MGNAITYRVGTINDKAQMTNLALVAYGQFAEVLGTENWGKMKAGIEDDEKLQELITRGTAFVCEHENSLIGMAFLIPSGNPTVHFDANWCYIRWVSVAPEFEGRGIGKSLTRMCIDHAIAMNERIIALHTSEFQNAARHIYERMGFTVNKEIGPAFGKQYWVYTKDLGEDRKP